MIPWTKRTNTLGLALTLLGAGALTLPAAGGCNSELSSDIRNCDVQSLFSANCAGAVCHSAGSAQGDLDLTSPGVDQRLFHINGTDACGNEKLIDPGHPSSSLLFEKVTESSPSCGEPMPPSGSLTDNEIACLRDYIERAGIDTQGPNCETCGGILCVDFARDPAHCGGCGQACDDGKICGAGQCVNPCEEEETLCGATCVILDDDDDHCGTCGHRCGPGTSCNQGVCQCDDSESGGGGGAGGMTSFAPGEVPSFADDILPLFDNSCSGADCHTTDERIAPLGLDPADAYAHLVDAMAEGCESERLVVPGSPDQSYLVDKILGGDLCAGEPMPLAADELPNAAKGAIIRWICEGAPDN